MIESITMTTSITVLNEWVQPIAKIMSEDVGCNDKYHILAGDLGLSSQQIYDIRDFARNQELENVHVKVLEAWLSLKGKDATVQTLINVLEKYYFFGAADDISSWVESRSK